MPELPEVETIVRGLVQALPGRTIAAVEVLKPDLIAGSAPEDFVSGLVGKRIAGVERRAKNIVVDLGRERLVVNLGMTGRLIAVGSGDPDPAHLGVRFDLDQGRRLLYYDTRRFGRLQLFPAAAWEARAAKMGVEPLSDEFTADLLYRMSRDSRVAIKVWLMDQHRVVGVGNIYASEALFRARIDPRRPAHSLKKREAAALRNAVQEVLREAIDYRGTTLLDYRDAEGNSGGFAERLRVYERGGEACPECGRPLERIVQGGRSTFFCPRCQR